jgi:hypothetical protein
MPKPIAYKTGTIQPPNTAKQNNILVGVGNSNWGAGSANATFYNSLDSSYQYVVVKNSNPPAMWGTGDFTTGSLLTTINGLPERVGQTRFTNVTTAVSWSLASGQYSILKSEEVYPAPVVDGLVASFNPKSVNRIPNGNFMNYSLYGGERYPFYFDYGSPSPVVVDISNDKPYVGSNSTKAMKMFAGGGFWAGIGGKLGLEVGKQYTISWWYKQNNSNNYRFVWNNQGGSGDNNFYLGTATATTTWSKSSVTFTHVIDKFYFFTISNGSDAGSELLMTEIQLEEGNTPTAFKNFGDYDLPTNGGLSTGSWSLNNMTGYQQWAWDGSKGGCYNFDGVDDFIRLSDTPPITTALTYTAWVYTNAFSSNNAVFNIRGTLFELNQGGLSYWSDVFQGNSGASYSFTTGSWNFVAVTQNNTAVTFYVNGSQINTATQPSINMSYGSSNSNFLGTYLSSGRFLNGKIGNAQIYNRALSATEIENLYNADVSTYLPTSSIVNQGLSVYYDFSNPNSYPGSGTTVYDLSGYGNNGTLTNGPTFSTDSGGALVFDGVDDYVQFTSTYAGTICFWGIADAGATDGLQALVGVTSTGDGALRFLGGTFRGNATGAEAGTADNNDYQFGYVNQFMINGVSSLPKTYQGFYVVPNSRTLTQNFYVGAIGNRNVSTLSHTFMGRVYKGKIFKVMIYNRQLTNAELLQNYNATKAQYGL